MEKTPLSKISKKIINISIVEKLHESRERTLNTEDGSISLLY